MGFELGRRDFLRGAGSAGLMAGMPAFTNMAPAQIAYEHMAPEQSGSDRPEYTIKFAVCGMSHDHIYGMVNAVKRGGGVLVKAFGAEPDKLADSGRSFPRPRS